MRNNISILVALLLLFGCSKRNDPNNTLELENLKITYISQLEAIHKDLVTSSNKMDNRISFFYQNMTFTHFEMSKTEWKEVYKHLNYFGPFRFGGGLEGFYSNLYQNECSSWPLNMHYIDYTQNMPNAGYIQDPSNYPDLGSNILSAYNQVGSEQNLSLGMHVIEFLLWGEDLNPNGPGNRLATDFTVANHFLRRRLCLLQTNKAFLSLVSNSKPDNNFKTWFMSLDRMESLYHILSGIYRFTRYDFAENSIQKPLLNGESFEESRFSDNSIKDLENKLQALKYLLMKDAYFTKTQNYGLYDFIEKIDPSVNSSIQSSLQLIGFKLQDVSLPLDQAISDPVNSQRLTQIYNELISIANKLSSLASSQGISTLE
jgi:putative iron-regulated protein